MNFKKTLLAATLAATSFSVMAANQANITRYVNGATNESIIRIDSFANGATSVGNLQVGQIYKYEGNTISLLSGATGLPTGYIKEAAGMVEVTESVGQDKTDVKVDVTGNDKVYQDNVDQNNYWSYGGDITTTTTTTITNPGGSITLTGLLVNTEQNGNTTEFNGDIDTVLEVKPGVNVSTTTSVAQSAKKDIQVGNLTQIGGSNTGGLAKYDFELEGNNAQGSLATIKDLDATTTSVAALTGNGLAVLDVATGGKVDLEKGTVTFTQIIGDVKEEKAISLTSYKTKDGKSVVYFGGKHYLVGDKNSSNNLSLTEFSGDTSSQNLVQDGYGLADTKVGGTNLTSVNTGLVSNKNVTYGETVTTSQNAGLIVTASTNPNDANEHSGNRYEVDSGKPITTSKDVVTGIIAEDAAGNKTYGLQTTTVVDNKVTGQTTVTADGITTTGDITVFAGTDKETTVSGLLSKATTDLNQKISEFGSTASRLNKRINDVEETAYRGIAIALAAQQQIPNIGAGQFAVFGGVGHYEGESAGALGLAGVLADGRTSLSAALGAAGNGEVGGRVGVAYVFGGK